MTATNGVDALDKEPVFISTEDRIINSLTEAGGALSKKALARSANVRELLLPSYMEGLIKSGRAKLIGDATYALPSYSASVKVALKSQPAPASEAPKEEAKAVSVESESTKGGEHPDLVRSPIPGIHARFFDAKDVAWLRNIPPQSDKPEPVVVHRQHAQALVDWLVATFGLKEGA